MSFILDNIIFILAMIFLAVFVWFWISYRKVAHKKWNVPTEAFPADWRRILNVEVSFYQTLDQQEKARFELKVQEFLLNCKITGVKTAVSIHDKLLVASSAVIPIFRFDNWRYTNIREVLLYPTTFDHNFQFEDEASERIILGMVGSHNMEGLMILSKEALELGFKNETDKHNTAIHEFVHLIDKSDGVVDGVPQLLLERQYTIPWLHIMKTEIERIQKGKSDINPYAATNNAEFFAVASEYFFERPELFEDKHPELYQVLEKVFSKRKF